jgi:hypothetical protein
MIKVKIFAQPMGTIGSYQKMYKKFEDEINEWLKSKIDSDIIGFHPGYGFVAIMYKEG